MILPDGLPYEAIGRATVALVALVVAAALVVVLLVVAYAVWWRGLTRASNRLWRGYSPTGERPPVWKLKISGVLIALRGFEVRKIPAVLEEAEELGGTTCGEDSDLQDARDYAETTRGDG